MSDERTVRMTAWVHGAVQGVGFRWWVYSQAKELGLAGSATNLVDGRVCVVAEGSDSHVKELRARLSAQDGSGWGRPGYVDKVVEQWSEPQGVKGFTRK